MNKKWMFVSGLAIVAIVFTLLWHFASDIQGFFADIFLDILLLAASFVVGWFFGRFGGRRRRNPDRESARNITRAQQ